jgi:hypothetical protein
VGGPFVSRRHRGKFVIYEEYYHNYSFDLPAPSVTPADGDYTVTVRANGTYAWDHWHENRVWHENWVDICNTDPVTGEQSCQRVDQGEWVADQLSVTYTIKDGHQFVHPATDHD